MNQNTLSPDDIHSKADEVARLMADRFGGIRRGRRPSLLVMLRRRGSALPRSLRQAAVVLAEADLHAVQPKRARQMDFRAISRAHARLIAHLRPLGEMSRWGNRTIGIAASLAAAALIIFAIVIWVMLQRGYI